MKKALAVLLLLAPLVANAGVVRYSAKHGYKAGKFAVKTSYRVAKKAAKVAF